MTNPPPRLTAGRAIAAATLLFAAGFLFGFGTGRRAVAGGRVVGVHLVGAVAQPGFYEVPAGTRLVELLEMGGRIPEADLDSLNLAETLFDGQRVEVPHAASDTVAAASGEAPASSSSPYPAEATGPLIDLNTAARALLETLPGIGPVKAQAIIQWREDHGGFASVEEILQVHGVGEVTLEKIRPLVTVG